jgi:hypothetical protein
MMISICSMDQDATGQMVFKESPGSSLHGGNARINRIATLDGGTILNHLGFSSGDRTIDIMTSDLTETEAAKLLDFYENDAGVICAIDIGVYFGAIASLDISAKPSRIRIQVQSKMSV